MDREAETVFGIASFRCMMWDCSHCMRQTYDARTKEDCTLGDTPETLDGQLIMHAFCQQCACVYILRYVYI